MLPWIRSLVARIYILTRYEIISFQFYLEESRYKTNYDSETAIPHYIDGVGRKYIPYWVPSLRNSAQYGIYFLPTSHQYLTIILRNRAEYRLILSRRGRAPIAPTGKAFQRFLDRVSVSLFTTQAISRSFLSVLTNASSALLLARALDLLRY